MCTLWYLKPPCPSQSRVFEFGAGASQFDTSRGWNALNAVDFVVGTIETNESKIKKGILRQKL